MDSGLRDYQQDMLVRLERAWHRHRSVLVQMPTGTGKTRLMAEVVRSSGDSVLVVAHRRELIAQIREALSS
ncbi:MAG: DEAD/DEAH box helicase family protein, partial [Bacteroidaceae bacterium]|nr:DEAD/DEAH box helicase family protein [Bacteroidaceae bacterium]